MTVEEQIDALFELTINNVENEYKRIDLGVVSKELGLLISNMTNVDVTDYVITLDTYSISHTLERHGNPIKEAKLGQIAVQKHHFFELLEVILNPDSVRYDVRNNRSSLIFEKEKEDKYFIVKEIRQVQKLKKKNRLVLQTFYIRKKTL
jgi:hypothetical protein